MEKELKSYMGVLSRVDLTGHGHPTLFGRNWLNWLCPVKSALKRTPVQDFNSFSIMFYYIFSTTYQRIGDLFWPVHIYALSHSVPGRVQSMILIATHNLLNMERTLIVNRLLLYYVCVKKYINIFNIWPLTLNDFLWLNYLFKKENVPLKVV